VKCDDIQTVLQVRHTHHYTHHLTQTVIQEEAKKWQRWGVTNIKAFVIDALQNDLPHYMPLTKVPAYITPPHSSLSPRLTPPPHPLSLAPPPLPSPTLGPLPHLLLPTPFSPLYKVPAMFYFPAR
jgi:hypothetical protein